MASMFSQFVLIKWKAELRGAATLAYMGEVDYVPGSVFLEGTQGMFNPMAKIEVEASKTNTKYFHLRYYLTNKYWARNNADEGFVTAESTVPEEDMSKPSCTLFTAVLTDADGYFNLIHVASGNYVDIRSSDSRVMINYLGDVDPATKKVIFVNADTIVKLPKHVAFKGDNGKYLRRFLDDDHNYLKFSSDDPNDIVAGHEVFLYPTGQVRIKSDKVGLFWRGPNWIWADSPEATTKIDDTLFWPVKIDEKTIALRNAGNNEFCIRLSVNGFDDCLNADSLSITKEARLVLEELVLQRKINNVKYRLDESRIYGETPYVAGSSTVANHSDNDAASMEVEIEYKEEKSYLFSGSVSLTLGASATVEAGIPFIAEASVTVSASVTAGLSWEKTETSSVTLKAKTVVPVPAKSSVKVKYVGTKGSCSVPFVYTRQDKSSVDGVISRVEMIDGFFTGVSCYNFYYEVEQPTPL